MVSTSNINIRTDAELKANAQKVLADLGLDMTTAINVFLKQVVYRQAIPFELAKPAVGKVKLGGWEGKIQMADDFDAPLEDFRDYME